MATYSWRAATGAFDNPSNWSPAIVPGASDTALFASNGGTVTSGGAVDTIDFSANGWVLNGQISANTVNITTSTVTIDGSSAQLLIANSFSVFSSAGSDAFLTVSDAGTISTAQSAATAFGNVAFNVNTRGIANFNGPLSFGSGGATGVNINTGLLTVGGLFSLGTTSYGTVTLLVQGGAEAIVNAGADSTRSYLQIGVAATSSADFQLTGASTLLLVTANSATVGVYGSGELDVSNGASAQFNSSNNALDPALVIARLPGASGTVNVTGAGSALTANGSIQVGELGAGNLHISGGAKVTSAGIVGTVAALSVGAYGSGIVTIAGSGSQLLAAGPAYLGADNRGSGVGGGGSGSIAVTGGGLLQTYDLTIEAASSLSVDSASQEVVEGNASLFGTWTNSGTLSVTGFVSGTGALDLAGGFTAIGNLDVANVQFTGPNATLRVSAVSGNSQIGALQSGDEIDLVGLTASMSGNTVYAGNGSLTLGGAGPYQLSSDGSGGTFVTIGEATIGVYRFFDSTHGTQFLTSNAAEEAAVAASRPDLRYEGVGLQAVAPGSGDPNASPVYRFFDTAYGTHFFTASTPERDSLIATRPDLDYEGVGFYEHSTQQPGDVAVYRFFDSNYGTHFYTANNAERAAIVASRPDLIYEGIGFYAPS